MDTVYNNLRNLIIGKFYTSADLAYYNQGDKFPKVIVTNINASIDSVLLPSMSGEQEHRERVKQMTRRAIKTSTYIMAPLMMGLLFCAKIVVKLLLTDKWLPSVPYLQIFCFTYMLWPIHTANLNAIKAVGRSDLFLKLEVIKKIVGMILLLLTMKISVMAMAYSLIVSGLFGQIINAWPNRKLLDYSYFEQIRDVIPSVSIALIMGIIVYFVGFLPLPTFIVLIIQIIIGAFIYIGLSALLHLEEFEYLFGMVKSFLKR